MSFSDYIITIDQMVDVGLIIAMPSVSKMRREYSKEVRKLKRKVNYIKKKSFQKIILDTLKSKWIHEMQDKVVKQRRQRSQSTHPSTDPVAQPPTQSLAASNQVQTRSERSATTMGSDRARTATAAESCTRTATAPTQSTVPKAHAGGPQRRSSLFRRRARRSSPY